MKFQIKLIILMVTILMTTSGFAQDDTSTPLVIDKDSVIKLALENNDLVRAAEMMVISALADGKAQYAPFQPQLSTNYSYTRLDKAPTTVFDLGDGPQTIPVGNADNYKWSLDFVFPLYTGGADIAIKKMITINKGMAENNLDTARRGISFGALQAYFGVLSTLNLVDVRQASYDALSKAYEDAVKSQREGIFSNSDVLQIQVAKNKAEMDLKKANDQYRTVVLSLMQILSLSNDSNFTISPQIETPIQIMLDPGSVISLAEKRNSDIIATDLQISMLEKQIKLSDSGKKPALSFISSYSCDGDTPLVSGSSIGGDHNQFVATLNLSWSLYDSGKVSQEKLKIRESMEALKIQRKDSVQKLSIDIDSKITDYIRAVENIEIAKRNLESSQENFRIVNARFKEGLDRSSELLTAEAMLSGAKLEYEQSIYSSHIALANVAFLAGFENTRDFLDTVNPIIMNVQPVNMTEVNKP